MDSLAFYHLFQADAQAIRDRLAAGAPAEARELLESLLKSVQDAQSELSAYDQRSYGQTLAELSTAVHEQQPSRARFRFSQRPRAAPAPEPEPIKPAAPAAPAVPEPPVTTDATVAVAVADGIARATHLERCRVRVADPASTVQLADVVGSTVVVDAAVAGPTFLNRLHQSTVVLAGGSHQLRIHDCDGVYVYLGGAGGRAIIERCRGMVFGGAGAVVVDDFDHPGQAHTASWRPATAAELADARALAAAS
ncbi:uncharacterized protein V1510DRAFT_404478 [Dipodascopsis tothii]|uniref:uncharacterized protein n=1 Tax=Dipodascopsis tothii TaxID=44089 RepID=UPI0034CE870C